MYMRLYDLVSANRGSKIAMAFFTHSTEVVYDRTFFWLILLMHCAERGLICSPPYPFILTSSMFCSLSNNSSLVRLSTLWGP